MKADSSESFPKYLRIKHTLAFKRLFAHGTRINLEFVRVISLDNKLGHPRLGIVASRKILPKAVMRSKFKRAVREVFRKNKKYLGDRDYLVINLRNLDVAGDIYRAEDFEKYLKGVH